MVQTQISNGDFTTALDSWQAFRSRRDPDYHRLPPSNQAAWLSYALVGNQLALWIADSSGTDFHFIELNQIAAKAQRLSALLANPDSSVPLIHTLSRQLFQQLLGPVASRLAQTPTLIIDADAPLANIPWSVLENSTGQPLLESHALVLTRGWYEAASHAVNQPLQLRPGLIVADPELDDPSARSLPPLRDAREESFALQTRLPATKLLTGGDAKLNLVRQLLPHQRLLHYAGHGVSNGGFGALVLAKEPGFPMRLFTAQQISDLDLSSTELVVLAACSTGIGEQSGAFDLSSLVRAFLEAGATRVVAARWNIDSKPTARFMTEFYTGLLNKVPPAQSLRAAALAIRSKPLTSHPYYWAAFELYGGI
jgi:CHAT domain-containing protein